MVSFISAPNVIHSSMNYFSENVLFGLIIKLLFATYSNKENVIDI